MNVLGQISLFGAFAASGYAAYACFASGFRGHRRIGRSGDVAAVFAVLLLTMVAAVLVWALITKDFHFAYVAHYSSLDLPWHYSLSAFWVGQAGSLLCWAWMLGMLALLYRFWPRCRPDPLHVPAFGILMAYVCFLTATMVFGVDPMALSLEAPRDGLGLSPLLQHPVMLVHPPVVLLGYAAWTLPFALAIVGLLDENRRNDSLGSEWPGGHHNKRERNPTPFFLAEARRWSLFAWCVSGGGILLGSLWAYEELGWGGYWSWDAVENGSLIPWLTGTALIHALMAWRARGVLKRTSYMLAIATFGLCNFATFLTRSGFFSSLHAFSESPIGWMFLTVMLGLATLGGLLVLRRWKALRPERPILSVLSREALMLFCIVAMVLLAIVTLVGTLGTTLSKWIVGQSIVVGPPFYNSVLIPLILVLLVGLGVAPVSRWGKGSTALQKKVFLYSIAAGGIVTAIVYAQGVRHWLALAIAWLITLAAATAIDTLRRSASRRQVAGAIIHIGFLSLVVGVTGSSLGSRQHEVVLHEGQSIVWADRSIRLVRLTQEDRPDKIVAAAELEISRDGVVIATLAPAKHLYRRQDQWTTEVAIHSTWSSDLYTIVLGPEGPGKVALALIENPLIRWLWISGWIIGAGTLVGLWPRRRATVARRGMPAAKSQPPLAA